MEFEAHRVVTHRSLSPFVLAGVAGLGLLAASGAVATAAVTTSETTSSFVSLDQRELIPALAGELVAADGATFEVRDGRVAIGERADAGNVFVTETDFSDGRVTFVADEPGPGYGFIFRARDDRNYWAAVSYPGFEGWQLEKVIDGDGTAVGSLVPGATDGEVEVVIDLGGPFVTLAIGDEQTTVADGYLAGESKVGFLARPGAFPRNGWRDVRLSDIGSADEFVDLGR